jgi:luciferase family oxidoreductase group 1
MPCADTNDAVAFQPTRGILHHMTRLSVLDLCPIVEGSNAAQSFRNMRELAVHAEQWGYRRYWLAEHHGMTGIASAATSILISEVARATTIMRVGAGGIMLPNHAPLIIAEQFGTLASLYPDRIDLGLGRAPGSDVATTRALRRDPASAAESFPYDVQELLAYFTGTAKVPAVPGNGLDVPVWILGSSLYGAQLAAALGLPYAFASHFAPAQLDDALRVYRERFQPSKHLKEPYVMLGFNVFAANDEEQAQYLASSMQQAFVLLHRGQPGPLPPPVPNYPDKLSPRERTLLKQVMACSSIGTPDTVRADLEAFITRTAADELMITSQIFDHAARLRAHQIAAEAMHQPT